MRKIQTAEAKQDERTTRGARAARNFEEATEVRFVQLSEPTGLQTFFGGSQGKMPHATATVSRG